MLADWGLLLCGGAGLHIISVPTSTMLIALARALLFHSVQVWWGTPYWRKGIPSVSPSFTLHSLCISPKKSGVMCPIIHCIIHQESLCGKCVKQVEDVKSGSEGYRSQWWWRLNFRHAGNSNNSWKKCNLCTVIYVFIQKFAG